MKLVFSSEEVETVCTSQKAAKKFFGGNEKLSLGLLSRVNALRQAPNLKDIVVQPPFHFHKLKNKSGRDLEGLFAIDVKTRRDPWRLILQPLDENECPFDPCNIDEIAIMVRVIGIVAVSKHYE